MHAVSTKQIADILHFNDGTWKHLYWSFFLINLEASALVFQWILQNFKEQFLFLSLLASKHCTTFYYFKHLLSKSICIFIFYMYAYGFLRTNGLNFTQEYSAVVFVFKMAVFAEFSIPCCYIKSFFRGHPLSTYAKFSEKLTFLTPWYIQVRVRIRGLEMLVFSEILRT